MNTLTTVRARRVNNAQQVGQHFTLTRVINEPDRCFAFGVSDDGTKEVYIPSNIVKREQMTSADEGAGFTCALRSMGGFDNDGGHPHAMLPFNWDGESEEVQVEGPAVLPDDMVAAKDFDDLANACGSFIDNTAGPINDMVDRFDKLMQGAGILFGEAKKLKAELESFQKRVDIIAPVNED